MNIVVLAGGLSPERDVSLATGSLVTNALRRCGQNAILVDFFFGVETLPEDISDAFLCDEETPVFSVPAEAPDLKKIRILRGEEGAFGGVGKHVLALCKAADIVFMAMHGEPGEDGKVQAMFDMMEIKYTGSGYVGSAVAMSKKLTKQLLVSHGINTPPGRIYTVDDYDRIMAECEMPCIVKPCSGGSSIGIVKAENTYGLENAVKAAFAIEGEIIIETFIKGRELTCGVLGGVALPVAEIVPKGDFYDYEHKYQAGMITEIIPAQVDDMVTEKLWEISRKVFKTLGLSVYARMDYILSETNEIYCLEANTLPGLTPTSHMPQEAKAAGIGYDALCMRIVELSLLKYEAQNG